MGGQSLATQKKSAHKDRPQNQKQFAAQTAAVAKISKSSVNQELRRANELGEDAISRLCGTSLDKGYEMDALIKLPAEEREAFSVSKKEGSPRSSTRASP